jgi:hypothetical protein
MSYWNKSLLTPSRSIVQANCNIPQQRMPPEPWHVQHNAASPSTSTSLVEPAPVERTLFSNCHPGNAASINNENDSSVLGIDMLAPTGHVTRNHPLDRHYHEESWNPYHLRNSSTSNDQTSFDQSNASLNSIQTGLGSTGSIAPISDSGFYSQSVVSHDTGRVGQPAVPCDLTQQTNNMTVRSTNSVIEDNDLKCRDCNKVSKCKSDYKYASFCPSHDLLLTHNEQKTQTIA